MPKPALLYLCALALSAGLLACSDEDSDGPANPGTCDCDVTAGVCDQGCPCDTFCAGGNRIPPGFADALNPQADAMTSAQALCERDFRCYPALAAGGIDSPTACVDNATEIFRVIFEAYQEAIAAGQMGFSRARFDACNQARMTADCFTGFDADACALSTIFAGAQGRGEPCSVGGACAGDQWCRIDAGTCGVCTERAPPGGACAQTLCPFGESCFDFGNNVIRCLSVSRAEGETCGPDDGFCGGLLRCVGRTNDQPGICRRPGTTVGEVCDVQNQSAPDCSFFANLVCGASGTCETINWVGAGQSCSGVNFCDGTTLECNADDATCTPAPQAGEVCTNGCARGLFCAPGSVCQALGGAGSTCSDADQCRDAYSCQNGVCRGLTFQDCAL